MKLPSIFKNKDTPTKQPWQWPSCNQPKTLSFRATNEIFKTVNSIYIDPIDDLETPDSWFTNSSSESASFSAESYEFFDNESLEMVVNGVVRSDRLFFEPGDTRSILEVAKTGSGLISFKESVVLAMESNDPYFDFKRSMEEMVESHGLKDWGCLEELLCWYLKVNGKKNHGFIVGAFVDLLIGRLAVSSNNGNSDYSSALSSLSSSSSASQNEIGEQDEDGDEEEEKMVLS